MDFAEQLKSSVDIVKVIGEVVRLNKASANRYAGFVRSTRRKPRPSP